MTWTKHPFLPAALAILLLALAPTVPAAAQSDDDGDDDSGLHGSVLIGVRDVSVDGAVRKYNEDYNLQDGPRLFGFSLDFTPEGPARDAFDTVRLDMNNLGGEPFESLRLDVEKWGRYDFTYQRTESDYFYEDLLGIADDPTHPHPDFRTFDLRRVRDRASLDLDFNPRATLTLGFDRYRRSGESTIPLDIQRDEFDFDAPIDEESRDYTVAFQYRWDKVTVVLEERVREYENDVSRFLPGFSLGLDEADPATLDFFFLDQPYEFTSYNHTVRVVANPTSRLTIRAAGTVQQLDMDISASEESQGTTFRGDPFTTDLSGAGEITRDANLFDLDLSYLLTDRVALIGGVYYRDLDQEGDFLFGGSLAEGLWDIETTGFEAGVQWLATADLSLTAGLRSESRDVVFGAEEGATAGTPVETEDESTDHDGWFATVDWQPTEALRLTADYEDSSYDDPFALASPTDRSRLSLRARWNNQAGFNASASYVLNEYENSLSGWDSETETLGFDLGYTRGPLSIGGGWTSFQIDRAIDQVVRTVGFGGGQELFFPIFYEADTDLFTGRLRWRVNDAVTLGANAALYDNSGSFALARDDIGGFVEWDFLDPYRLRLGYRTIDYSEDLFDFDDYDADITEIGIGYRW